MVIPVSLEGEGCKCNGRDQEICTEQDRLAKVKALASKDSEQDGQ